MVKVVFSFDDKSAKKLKNKKNILGGKGANLGEMGRLGLPVPPGFIISTEVCHLFYQNLFQIYLFFYLLKFYYFLYLLLTNCIFRRFLWHKK